MLLVGIVPVAALDDLSRVFSLINGLIAHVAVLGVDDEIVARHLLHAVLVESPRFPQSIHIFPCVTSEQGNDKVLDIRLTAPETDRDVSQAVVIFEGFGLSIDGLRTVPGERMYHGPFVTAPVLDGDVLSRPRQIAEYLLVFPPVTPTIALQDRRLWDEGFLLRVIVVGTQHLDAGVCGFAQEDSQQFVTVGAIPITSRHILAVGTGIAHTHETVLGIDSDSEFRLFVEHLLGETFLHRLPYDSHHPRRPCLVEALQHDAETAVNHVIDGLCAPPFIDIFK